MSSSKSAYMIHIALLYNKQGRADCLPTAPRTYHWECVYIHTHGLMFCVTTFLTDLCFIQLWDSHFLDSAQAKNEWKPSVSDQYNELRLIINTPPLTVTLWVCSSHRAASVCRLSSSWDKYWTQVSWQWTGVFAWQVFSLALVLSFLIIDEC